ncbi:hypothetical protein D3C79_606320 [compost metagenome]
MMVLASARVNGSISLRDRFGNSITSAERVPVGAHAGLAFQAKRPFRVAAGAGLDLQATTLGCQLQQFVIQVLFFGHDDSLAAISRQ